MELGGTAEAVRSRRELNPDTRIFSPSALTGNSAQRGHSVLFKELSENLPCVIVTFSAKAAKQALRGPKPRQW